jgi:hypothetical protein
LPDPPLLPGWLLERHGDVASREMAINLACEATESGLQAH